MRHDPGRASDLISPKGSPAERPARTGGGAHTASCQEPRRPSKGHRLGTRTTEASPSSEAPGLGSVVALGLLATAVLACLLVSIPTVARGATAAAPSHQPTLVIKGFVKEGPVYVPPPEGEFEDACGLAVAPSGELAIADYYHRLIYSYTPGGFYTGTETQVEGPDGPCGLSFDAAGDLYVERWHGEVLRLPLAGEGVFGPPTVLDPARSTGIYVDPVSGRIYVDERSRIAVFEADGSPVLVGGLPLRIGEGSLGSGYGVAVSGFAATEGDVYVADAAAGLVRVYGPAGEELPSLEGLGTPQHGFVSLADSDLAVDPGDGHVFVVDDLQPGFEHPQAVVDEFNLEGDYRGQLPQQIIDAEPSALAMSGSDIYVTSGNDEKAAVLGFGSTFAAHQLSVTVTGQGQVTSEPAGIDCPGACGAEYNVGEGVFLTPTPAAGYAFAGWSGACSGNSTCRPLLSADQEVGAEFTPLPPGAATPASVAAPTGAASPPPAGSSTPAAPAFRAWVPPGARGEGELAVSVPAAGTLRVGGSGLRTRVLELGAGERVLRCRLDRAALRALRRPGARELNVLAVLRFEPHGAGVPMSVLRSIALAARPKGRG